LRVESYKYRGLFTALLFFLLLLLPSAPFEFAGYVGIAFFTLAFFLRVWARMYIGEHSRGEKLACPEIVKAGPYRYIKHPLYLSNFMVGVAFAFFHAGFSLGTLVFCAIYGCFLASLAYKENKFLISGSVSHVPCPKQSVIKSIISDRFTWLWQIVMILLIKMSEPRCPRFSFFSVYFMSEF